MKREAPYGFRYVTATQEEVEEYRQKNNGRNPSSRRVRCLGCEQRIWGAGFAIGAHRKKCSPTGRWLDLARVTHEGAESHAVFGTTHDHRRFRVTPWCSWGAAIDEWERYDANRGDWKFFEVRSVDDPKYNKLPALFSLSLIPEPEAKPEYVKLSRPERERLLEIGRAAGSLDDANDAIATELLGDERWQHLEAIVISDYAWAAANFCFPQEAKYL